MSPRSLRDKRLGFIGLGKIGEALLKGFFEAGSVTTSQVIARSGSADSTALACTKLGITAAESNAEVAARAEILIIGVKPQVLPRVLAELRASQALASPPLILSVVASWSTARIEDELGAPVPVIRVMPNTPSLVRAGMSVLSPGRCASSEQLELAQSYFNGVGRSAVLEERLMDAVTGLSGSGPAYIYLVIEALAEAGVKVGIPRDVSTLLSAQTVFGAAQMVLESQAHPALLRDAVTTPAGCTVDGLLELEEGKLRVTLIKAVVKAAERAAQLSQ